MVQKNVTLLARHAGTSAADSRARLRAHKFTSLRQGLHEACDYARPLSQALPGFLR